MIVVDFSKIQCDRQGNPILTQNKHTYVSYNCFDELKQKAREKAESWVFRDKELYDRFHVNNENATQDDKLEKRIKRAQDGILGELAFEHLLQQLGIPYDIDYIPDSVNCDSYDFMIGGKTIDVKVGNYQQVPKYSDTYGYPVDQCSRHKDYVVIGYLIESKREIGFIGYTTHDYIKSCKVAKINSCRGYTYNTDNYEFPFGALEEDLLFLLTHILNKDGAHCRYVFTSDLAEQFEYEIRRTNTKKEDVLRKLNINTLNDIETVNKELVDECLKRLKERATHYRN